MKKAFIPTTYRPVVPGSTLEDACFNESCLQNPPEKISSHVFLIAARNDIVPYHFLKEIDCKENINHLHYDDLGTEWDFSLSNGVLKIHLKQCEILPSAIYHRHPGVAKDHPYYQKHMALFEVLDIWKGNLIGQKREHYHNSSKAYQGITSIRYAAHFKENLVKYPRSFFLKGNFSLLKSRYAGSLVVKSCSNIRSKVVSNEIFHQWDFANTQHVPTLFQEKIEGSDIRVHICDRAIWALKVENKDFIDYRYASKGMIQYQEIQLPKDIKAFCQAIAQYENNCLVGVDLMKFNNSYFCLESNPGPGWSTFNHSSKKKICKKSAQ